MYIIKGFFMEAVCSEIMEPSFHCYMLSEPRRRNLNILKT
jgi:hypothetical protein